MDNKEDLTLVKNEIEEYFIDSEGRKQGEYKQYESVTGKILEISNYVDNNKDGEHIKYRYNTNNIWFQFNYRKNLLYGQCIWYYFSGRKELEGNYVDGKEEGYWFEYENEENVIPKIIYYENGIQCDPPSIEVKNARKKI